MGLNLSKLSERWVTTNPRQQSRLLNLPLDLCAQIVELLPTTSRILLSLTCSDARRVMISFYPSILSPEILSDEEKLEILYALACGPVIEMGLRVLQEDACLRPQARYTMAL
jgi:hypothetical protein